MSSDFDVVDQYRKSRGLPDKFEVTSQGIIRGYNYTVQLRDSSGTVKIVFDDVKHQVGDEITDLSSGFVGVIQAVEEVKYIE